MNECEDSVLKKIGVGNVSSNQFGVSSSQLNIKINIIVIILN